MSLWQRFGDWVISWPPGVEAALLAGALGMMVIALLIAAAALSAARYSRKQAKDTANSYRIYQRVMAEDLDLLAYSLEDVLPRVAGVVDATDQQ